MGFLGNGLCLFWLGKCTEIWGVFLWISWAMLGWEHSFWKKWRSILCLFLAHGRKTLSSVLKMKQKRYYFLYTISWRNQIKISLCDTMNLCSSRLISWRNISWVWSQENWRQRSWRRNILPSWKGWCLHHWISQELHTEKPCRYVKRHHARSFYYTLIPEITKLWYFRWVSGRPLYSRDRRSLNSSREKWTREERASWNNRKMIS